MVCFVTMFCDKHSLSKSSSKCRKFKEMSTRIMTSGDELLDGHMVAHDGGPSHEVSE